MTMSPYSSSRVARHLAATLRHKHELRVLNLEGNEMKSSGAMAIVESLRHANPVSYTHLTLPTT